MHKKQYDALVIGGGPGGSTAAALLAKAGKQVAVFERETFPRFHIGESLLPASVPIFKRLGMHEEIKKRFILKPGGKWMYGSTSLHGDFQYSDPDSSFHDYPYAYMVERSVFDQMLLDNAQKAGAHIYYQHQVSDDLIMEGERVVGLKVKDPSGNMFEVYGKMIFDCSGQRALIANKLKLRYENTLKRMALFCHYKAKAIDKDLKNGWFFAEVIDDGWIWLIPLEEEKISVGAVISVEHYQKAKISPEAFLEKMIDDFPLVKNAMSQDAKRSSDVHVLGNLGYTSDQLYGEGWVLIGDAGFFIDPCYSSGVHMAMSSAQMAVDNFLEGMEKGDISAQLFQKYQEKMKHHEKAVTAYVKILYMASKNRTLGYIMPRSVNQFTLRKFGTFIGGDFSKNNFFVTSGYVMAKIVNTLCP